MKQIKSEFSINEIGKFRFYSGILIGIGFSIILNSLFRQTLRLCNLGTDIDQWNLNYEITIYYYLLIGFTSIGFAFCFTTYLWMSKPFATNRRKTLKLRMAQLNPIWIFFGTLMFLLRMFWFLAGVELTIEKDFSSLGFMIPVFTYLYCWNLISDIYRSKKAFLISSIIFVVCGFILSGI